MSRRTILDHTPDGLKRRIADLERGLADERRKGYPAPQYVEPDGGKIPFLVAAADAHPATKAVASYQCTGADDQTVIQQAVDDLFAGDAVLGRVLLSEGTFYLSGTVDCYTGLSPGFVDFEGMGAQVTYVEQQPGATRNFYAFTGEGLQGLRNLQIKDTQGGVYDLLSNTVVQGCQFWQLDSALFAQTTGEITIASNLFYQCGVGISGETLTDAAITGNVFAQSTTADISCTTSSNLAVVGNISTGSAAFCVLDGVEVEIGVGNVVDGVLSGQTPVVETDANGWRFPIRDETGAVVGYTGWDGFNEVLGMWWGDADGLKNFDVPLISLGPEQAYIQNGINSGVFAGMLSDGGLPIDYASMFVGGAVIDIEADEDIKIKPGTGRTLRMFNGTGITGTATPSTAAELADVLVDLGIIASHTIT